MTNNKELRKILRKAGLRGWKFNQGKRHIKGRGPNGRTATISVSPSDSHALRNIQKDLK